ncbi:transcriptional regulator [Bacillus sp. FJAT-42376]|uniref:two-component system regulatory protein YycI n=1 Tax=Bacillus sp. FJAT-42376 TaxID=2014076 RepID=UPI000F4EC405|nr:two-component system regulatory protein YycI [Bacillus sp. FJAT-42376]AZB41100.1 transcriptional regulator [Bacillus sp. FJAT-42376]
MDWSKTKTIFIFAFLVLDLFLVWQYSQKVTTSKYDSIQSETIQEQLKAEGITYPPLPADSPALGILTVERRPFTSEEIAALKDQKPLIDIQEQIGETKTIDLQMELKTPVKINPKDLTKADSFVSTKLLFGGDYVFWNFDQKAGTITYIQRINNKIVYQKGSVKPMGAVILHLNNRNEVKSYEQTYMKTSGSEEEQKLDSLTAINVIQQLYNKNDLKSKDAITKIDLGYYTAQELNKQSLQPYWYIEVNERDHYFVNAYDGQIIRPDQQKKME